MFFRIAWCLRTNIKSSGEVSMIIFLDILITDLSAIYTIEKNGSGPIKKLPCKPSVPCFHEMDPDSLFSGFGATGGYGPKTEKRPDPFSCKALCKLIFVRYVFNLPMCSPFNHDFILKKSVCSEKSLNSHQYSLKHCPASKDSQFYWTCIRTDLCGFGWQTHPTRKAESLRRLCYSTLKSKPAILLK